MNRRNGLIITCVLMFAAFVSCGQRAGDANLPESKEAKQLLQGVWSDEEAESIVFLMKGDSVYYPDSTSQPTYFAIVDDQLVLMSTDAHYHIEKQTSHVFWFKNQSGDIVRLVKSDEPLPDEFARGGHERVMTYTEVVKQDSVVVYDNNRYHWYVAINPTKYKVSRPTINEDGMEVENVYYDNIIHLSIFEGSTQLFSRDFRRQQFADKVPAQILQQSILNNMEFAKVDANGFHFNISVCAPDDASCYLIDQTVSFSGKSSVKLLEY